MKKIAITLILTCWLAVFTQAQIRTVKGNYCGSLTGNRGGSFGFRIGAKVMVFDLNFGQRSGNAKMVRFNVNRLKIGDEFIIKYDDSGEELKFIQTITGTGKKKKISPCSVE